MSATRKRIENKDNHIIVDNNRDTEAMGLSITIKADSLEVIGAIPFLIGMESDMK